MLRTDEFRGRPQGSSPCVREGTAGETVGRESRCRDRTCERGSGVGEEPRSSRGADRLPGETSSVHPQLSATATSGVMDCKHTSGEIQRLGGLRTLQAPGDELVATGVVALAALEAARRNGEIDTWR